MEITGIIWFKQLLMMVNDGFIVDDLVDFMVMFYGLTMAQHW